MTKEAILNLISERSSLLLKNDFIEAIHKTLSDKDIEWVFKRVTAYAITCISDENHKMNLLLSYDEFGLSLTSIVPYRSFSSKEVKLVYAMHMINLLRNYSDTEVIDSCLSGVPLTFREVMEIILYMKEVILYIEDNGIPKSISDSKTRIHVAERTIKMLNIMSKNIHKSILELTNLGEEETELIEDEFNTIDLRIEPVIRAYRTLVQNATSFIKVEDYTMTELSRRDIINKVVTGIFPNARFDEYLDEGVIGIVTFDVMSNIESAYQRAMSYMNMILKHEDSSVLLSSVFTTEYVDMFEEAYATIVFCRKATEDGNSLGSIDDPELEVMAHLMSKLYTELGIDHRFSVVNYMGW